MKIKVIVKQSQIKVVLMIKNDLAEEIKVKEIGIKIETEIERSNINQEINKERKKKMIKEIGDLSRKEIEKKKKDQEIVEIVIETEEKILEIMIKDRKENLMIEKNQKINKDLNKGLEIKNMSDQKINNVISVIPRDKSVNKKIVNQMEKMSLETTKIVIRINKKSVVLRLESKKMYKK